jgi:hypothetical protein
MKDYVLTDLSDLLGKTIKKVQDLTEGSKQVLFYCTDDTVYSMYHPHKCCEDVRIYELDGDASCLEGGEVLAIEENSDAPNDYVPTWEGKSETWTFYNIRTTEGYVNIRWYGTSNGYYSEEVSFAQVKEV